MGLSIDRLQSAKAWALESNILSDSDKAIIAQLVDTEIYRRSRAGRPRCGMSRAEQTRMHVARWRLHNAHKSRAHQMVKRAVDRGDLVRLPCENCGEAKTHGHHDDYDKPLDVRWLCAKCHKAAHKAASKARDSED